MKRYLLIASIVTGLAMVAIAAHAGDESDDTGTIIVTAIDFNNEDGQAVVGLYRRGEHWLDLDNAYRTEVVKIKKGTISVKLDDVPYGEYGITVLHDKNSNGKMDMRWVPYPKPKEGGGVSNNWVRNGKPEYSKAKFDLDRSFMSVRIKIVY